MADRNRQMEAEKLESLMKAFKESEMLHAEIPDTYYLGKVPNGFEIFHRVFKELKACRKYFYNDLMYGSEAVPDCFLIKLIKKHVKAISFCYPKLVDVLIDKLLLKILPFHPNPLRHEVLSSMSIFSARVYIHDAAFSPDPVQSYVDGNFDLVVDLVDHVIRVPLLSGPSAFAHIPDSIRFKGINPEDEERIRHFVTTIVPKNGFKNLLHAYISALNAEHDTTSYVFSILRAIKSPDFSFAISFCALARNALELSFLRYLFNILQTEGILDHFVRCLAATYAQTCLYPTSQTSPHQIALSNLFLSCSEIKADQFESFDSPIDVLNEVCANITSGNIGSDALYVLKLIFVTIANVEWKGPKLIATFVEIVLRPYIAKYTSSLDTFKMDLIMEESEEKEQIEKAIASILSEKAVAMVYPSKVEDNLRELHDYLFSTPDRFVQMIKYLNSLPKEAHPAFAELRYVYNMF